jgi:DNA-3-methyladenine glycosylase II
MINIFREEDIKPISDWILKAEPRLELVIEKYGYPPFWHREPNFETLILIILEQQVSLASAASAFKKLKEKICNITPENLLSISYEELKSCYFSRQKIIYARHLATAIIEGILNLEELNKQPDEKIRVELVKIKGIGNWTVDTYLLMSLHRADIFPAGDLATIKSIKELNLVQPESSLEEIIDYMERFSPYRSIATYLLWHSYIQKRKLIL